LNEQVIVYAVFMAAAVELLRTGGELIAITPRNFCKGLYFRECRRRPLARMSLRRVHLFESRRATFKDSESRAGERHHGGGQSNPAGRRGSREFFARRAIIDSRITPSHGPVNTYFRSQNHQMALLRLTPIAP